MTSHSSAPDFIPWQRRMTVEALVWNGITILLSYEPDWLGLGALYGELPLAHLELQVLSPRGAPLPLGDDGYWSEFISLAEALGVGGPRALAFDLLEEFSRSQSWRVKWARWEAACDSG